MEKSQIWTDDFLNKKRRSGDPFADKLIRKIVNNYGVETSRSVFDKLIRYFVGKNHASQLGVSQAKGCFGITIPAFISLLFNLTEELEEKSPLIELAANQISMKLVHGMVNYFDNYKQTYFRVPDEFASRWDIT
jgi:hypothetical protein